MTLQFEIHGQVIALQPHPPVAADSIGYLTAAFTFPSAWSGTKSAIFTGSDGVPYTVLLDDNRTCAVPWEVIKAPYFTVSAFAGERITATTVEVPVLQSGYVEGKTPKEPTPTAYEQLVKLVKNEKEAAEAAAERAEAAEVNSQNSAIAAQTSTDMARSEADLARSFTDQAFQAQMGAQAAAADAGAKADQAVTASSEARQAATTCTDILAQVEELTGITAEIKATLGVE